MNDLEEKDINISDDEEEEDPYFEDIDPDDLTPEQIQSLKEKYDATLGQEATDFLDKKEEVDQENYEVIRATKGFLKERTEKTYPLYLVTNHRKEPKFDEEGKPVYKQKMDENNLPVFNADGEPVLTNEQDYKIIKQVSEFIVRKPTDRDKLEFERFGVKNQEDIANLSPKKAKQVDLLIAKFLSRCVVEPQLSPEEWRNDVEQAIYQQLTFRLITASLETNEAVLVDFFTNV